MIHTDTDVRGTVIRITVFPVVLECGRSLRARYR